MRGSNTQAAQSSTSARWKIRLPTARFWEKFDENIDKGADWVETLTPIVKEVAEVLKDAPLVKTITGVIIHIIKIREEIKLNEKRCHEIILKILGLSEWICKRLLDIGQYGERVRDTLAKIETSLKVCETTLTDVFQALKAHRDRGPLARFTNRGLEYLDQVDRSVDHLKDMLNLDMTFSNALQQAVHDCTESVAPASQPPSSGHTHILPPKPHLMVERDGQLKISVDILLRKECSRIAILGGGGFGKTTLALSILHHQDISKRYKARYFLSCEPLGNVGTLLMGLGEMLGIKVTTSELLAAVRSQLEKSTTILCLDNFETPWDPPASRTAIEGLLASIADIPNVSLIITMRGAELPSKGHWLRLLDPLSPLSSESARKILQLICPNHVTNSSTEKLLHAIEGIPLAITLIANLLRSETSDDLWNRWESGEQTGIVETGGHDREANLDASIKLSVNCPRMKDVPDATTLLAALALLPDGFPVSQLKGLESYLGVSNIGKLLKTLRTVALIKPLDEAKPSPRIHMLSPIRLFCHRFLDLSSKIKSVSENLVAYYICLLSNAKTKIDDATYYGEIVPEIKNIHSIFQEAFRTTSGDSQDIAFHKLVKAVIYLSDWSDYTGYYATDTIKMAFTKTIDLPALHGRCILSIGKLHLSESEDDKAEECFREAKDLFKQESEHLLGAQASELLGDVLIYMQQFDQAKIALEECLTFYIEVDNEHGQANVRHSLGDLYLRQGQYSKAEEHFTRALEAYKLSQDHLGQSNTAKELAQLHYNCRSLAKAEGFANASLAAAKKANYATGEGNALMWLGKIYLCSDKLTDARQTFEQALKIYTKINNPIGQLDAADELGGVYIQLDELSTAEAVLMASVKVEQDTFNIPFVLSTLGWLYICGNHLDKAEHFLDRALILFQKFNSEFGQGLVLVHLGIIYLMTNQCDKAEQVLTGVEIAKLENKAVQMRRLWVLGDLYITKGQFEDAHTSLNAAMMNAKRHRSLYQQGNILRSMGTLHIKRGHIDLAITKFREALKFHHKAQWVSEQATDLQWLGSAYERLGRSEDAGKAFKKARELIASVHDIRTLSFSA